MMRINLNPKCKIKIIKAGIILKIIRTTRPLRARKNKRMTIKKPQNRNNANPAKIRIITINSKKRQQHKRIKMKINNLLTNGMISKS